VPPPPPPPCSPTSPSAYYHRRLSNRTSPTFLPTIHKLPNPQLLLFSHPSTSQEVGSIRSTNHHYLLPSVDTSSPRFYPLRSIISPTNSPTTNHINLTQPPTSNHQPPTPSSIFDSQLQVRSVQLHVIRALVEVELLHDSILSRFHYVVDFCIRNSVVTYHIEKHPNPLSRCEHFAFRYPTTTKDPTSTKSF
jgi:hypothetical protein